MRKFVVLVSLSIAVAMLSGCSVYAVGIAGQRAKFLAAEKKLEQKDYQRVDHLLRDIRDYPLYPYLLYRRVGSQPHRLGVVKKYLDEYRDTRYVFLLRRQLLKYLASTEQWQAYLDNYKPTSSYALQCAYHWALYKTGKIQRAMAGAEHLWVVGRSQPKTCDPLFAVWQESPRLTAELVWKRFGMALDNGKTGLARYLKRFLPSRDHAYADFWLSVHRTPKVLLQCDRWKLGNPIYKRIFVHGIKRLTRKNPVLAQRVWRSRMSGFQINEDERNVIDRRIGLALALTRQENATDWLGKIQVPPEDAEIRHWRVRAALANEDWVEVHAGIEALTESEKAEPRWSFWKARTLTAIGKSKAANEIFRKVARDRSLYGFLAADWLSLDYSFSNEPVSVSDREMEKLEKSEAFKAVREFLYFQRGGEARRQWRFAVSRLDRQGMLAAARLAEKWDWGRMAIMTLAKAKYWDDLELRFPLMYTKPVIENSRKQQLNPAIIFGLMRRESAFDHQALSPVGARGLMQIMPQTGRKIAQTLKEKWQSGIVLFNPDTNIRYGTSYLKSMLERFDHNFVLAMAAYNAGPHRVVRWLPKRKTMPADIWMEIIPFKETRAYVNAVLTYAVIYQKRLKKPVFSLSDYMPAIAPSSLDNPTRKKANPVSIPDCG